MKRRFVFVILVIGVGLVAAPAVFQMFTRAPKGGDMINEFRPYMSEFKVNQFQGYMAQIDEVHGETAGTVPALAADRLGISGAEFEQRFPATAAFNEQWDGIFADMNDDLLATMEEMLDNFAAVDALPPFPLFPFFFVAPGVIIAVLAWSTLRADRRGAPTTVRLRLLAVMGVGLIAAPAIFQMFSRAPKGKEMIDEFRPIMTDTRLATIQGYFLTIGVAEGELRNDFEPAADLSPAEVASELPALSEFHPEWGTISGNMAPMIGAMADNIDNYEAVDALPPFSLFPWFFVIPGVLVAALALRARGRTAEISGKDAFDKGLPASSDATKDFFKDLKKQAEARKDASRARASGGVPANPAKVSSYRKEG